MVKPEWGTKRSCPKCATRFYDLGKDNPIVCINCGVQWEAEPVLKSKQPMPFDAPKPEKEKKVDEDTDLDLADADEEEAPVDDDTDLGGDDDLGVATRDDDEES
ncbi:MAG: hypothetical protein JWO65_1467 [Sphingomonas bacterium]|jgi:uncharacterized protein (TIGR02300 family)|nr:hypothetical protein [Sphingomonas bacterium]